MTGIAQDLRQALRLLRGTPGATAAALVALAAGIGATTAVFSAIHAVFLTPLPFPEPDRLLLMNEATATGIEDLGVSYPSYVEWRAATAGLAEVAAYQGGQYVVGGREPVRVPAALVSASFYDVVGVRPAVGRAFSSDEDRPGGPMLAVLGHGLWRRRLGGDPDVVGRTIPIGGMPVTVVGVMPEGFRFPSDTELWLPLEVYKLERQATNRRVHLLRVVARLKERAALGDVRSALAQSWQAAAAAEDPGHAPTVAPLQWWMTGDLLVPLRVLMAAAVFLLLIACANAGTLMLARASARARDWAVRRALGAGTGRLARQVLAESLVLAAIGAGAGLLVASWGTSVFAAMSGDPRLAGITLHPVVLGFAMVASVATVVLSGVAPVLAVARGDLTPALGEGGPRHTGPHHLRSALVVSQVALSVVLLSGSGLMIASFRRLMGVDPGFRPERMLTLRLSLPPERYDEPAVVTDFFRRLPERLRGVPGVESVAAVSTLPVTPGEAYGEVSALGAPPLDGRPAASFRRVLPGYFETMGIPLLQGRDFDGRDDGRGDFVVIVNRSLADRLWPGQDPIGRRLKVGPPESEPWLTVVGVVADVRHAGLDAEAGLATFEPHAQRPRSTMRLAIRTGGAPGPVTPAVLSALRAIEPQLVIDEVGTMEGRIRDSLASRRFRMTLLAAFAAVALLLAGVGVYGVTAYSVNERTREIGIRMALGARPGDVLRLVLRHGLALAGTGLAIGLAGAWALSGFLRTLLYGVSATDPPTLAAVALVLLAVALVACLQPAGQAARLAPADVLRHD